VVEVFWFLVVAAAEEVAPDPVLVRVASAEEVAGVEVPGVEEVELELTEGVVLTIPHRQVNSGTGRKPEPLTLTTVPPLPLPLLLLSAPK
jgi:hypothetical protein